MPTFLKTLTQTIMMLLLQTQLQNNSPELFWSRGWPTSQAAQQIFLPSRRKSAPLAATLSRVEPFPFGGGGRSAVHTRTRAAAALVYQRAPNYFPILERRAEKATWQPGLQDSWKREGWSQEVGVPRLSEVIRGALRRCATVEECPRTLLVFLTDSWRCSRIWYWVEAWRCDQRGGGGSICLTCSVSGVQLPPACCGSYGTQQRLVWPQSERSGQPEVGAPLLHAARCGVMILSCFLWGWVMTASPSTRLLHQLHTQPRTDTPTCWPPPPAAAHAGVCTLNSPAQPRSLKRKPPPLCPPAPQHGEADLHLCSPGGDGVFSRFSRWLRFWWEPFGVASLFAGNMNLFGYERQDMKQTQQLKVYKFNLTN